MKKLAVGLIVLVLIGTAFFWMPAEHGPVALCHKLRPGVSGSQLAAEFGPPIGTSKATATEEWTLYKSCEVCSGPIRAVINDHGLVTALRCSEDEGIYWKL